MRLVWYLKAAVSTLTRTFNRLKLGKVSLLNLTLIVVIAVSKHVALLKSAVSFGKSLKKAFI
jgi:hypothetical protein